MILTLETRQTASTLLSMSIMRKNVKKELKKQKKKELLESWDFITESFSESLEKHTDTAKTFHFNIREVEVLHNFLMNYTVKYKKFLEQSKVDSKNDLELIEDLKEVEAKCIKLIEL